MPLYTFHLFKPDGVSTTFEAQDLAQDSDAFAMAGELLDRHLSCDYVEIWESDRPLLGRHRFQPVIRSVAAPSL